MGDFAAERAWDVVVVGGGFYGCCLALYRRAQGARVVLLEAEADLLLRASWRNQARIHQGYHYPRSLLTALRSRVNFPRFNADFAECVVRDFEKIYAVARMGSKVNALQFRRVCEQIGAPIRPAPPALCRLFDPERIEGVFVVEEYAFDATRLREILRRRLADAGVDVRCGQPVRAVAQERGGERIAVELAGGAALSAGEVIVCTYSQINRLLAGSALPLLPFKHELTEIALIEPPPPLRRLGITVMDGAFFSTMPFPARGLHSLSHVRYTPHGAWQDRDAAVDVTATLAAARRRPNQLFMLRDASRYLPSLAGARWVDSLFEVKTVLTQNEVDDGRPILLRRDFGLKHLTVVMGGKIDNIYDVLDAIRRSDDSPGQAA
ncbi:MAG TPA: FAD-dependent oxidoreductase [Candidatus Polarisedimenticolaceae bacterium]|nr:FAD-dependent oxidoreductase [Candidatus Polarisedimenticolaceae bacterium]